MARSHAPTPGKGWRARGCTQVRIQPSGDTLRPEPSPDCCPSEESTGAANHPVMQQALTQTIARTGGAIGHRAVRELATQIDWAIRKAGWLASLRDLRAASQADSLREHWP